MEDYVEELTKIMEVARRLMKGRIVPVTDEKKKNTKTSWRQLTIQKLLQRNRRL